MSRSQTYDPNWDATIHQPQRYTKERLQVRDYAQTRALLNRLYPNRGKLLEIGSGYGFLLAEFKKDGWDVQGVEPNGICCRYTGRRMESRLLAASWRTPVSPIRVSTWSC